MQQTGVPDAMKDNDMINLINRSASLDLQWLIHPSSNFGLQGIYSSLSKHHGSCVAVGRQRHASEYRDDMFNLHNQMNYGTNIFGLAAKRKNMLSHIFWHGFACCCNVCRHTIVV